MPDSAPAPSAAWTLGSSPDCDLVVTQPSVSGRHCRLSVHNDQYVLEDLGSTNGTFVNGYKLDPRSPVYVSLTDNITLGPNIAMPWPTASHQNVSQPSPVQPSSSG